MDLHKGRELRCVFRQNPWHHVINSISIEPNKWTHVACTRDHNGLITAWVDGKTGTLPQAYGQGYDGSPSNHDIQAGDPRIGENPAAPSSEYFPDEVRSFRAIKGIALYNATAAKEAGASDEPFFETPAFLGSCPFGTIAGVDCLSMDDGDEGAAECRDQEFENVQYAQVEEGFACRNTAKKPLDDGATHTEAECAGAVANGQCGNRSEFERTVQLASAWHRGSVFSLCRSGEAISLGCPRVLEID